MTFLFESKDLYTSDGKKLDSYTTLEYRDLCISLERFGLGAYEMCVDYDYLVDTDDIVEYILREFWYDIGFTEEEAEQMGDDVLEQHIIDNFEMLFDKFNKDILDDYEDRASEQAEEYFYGEYMDRKNGVW